MNTTQDSGSNYTTHTHTGSGGYISPWDFFNRKPVGYFFESNLHSNFGIYVRITPYIGLAYFDGADDGTYNTPTGAFNLASGAYPNLYTGSSEYGNYVQANPIVLANHSWHTPPWYTHELAVFSKEDHCPINNVNIGYNFNLQTVKLDIINNNLVQPVTTLGYGITPAPPAGTNAESQLLTQYGKVMYYKIEFGWDAYNFNPDDTYYALALEADPTADPGEWTNLSVTDSFNGDLYYHSGGAVTQEIVVDAPNLFINNTIMKKAGIGNAFPTSFGLRYFETRGDNLWDWGCFMHPAPACPGFLVCTGVNVHIRFY